MFTPPKKERKNYHREYYRKHRDKLLLSAKIKHQENMKKTKLLIPSLKINEVKKLEWIKKPIIILFE